MRSRIRWGVIGIITLVAGCGGAAGSPGVGGKPGSARTTRPSEVSRIDLLALAQWLDKGSGPKSFAQHASKEIRALAHREKGPEAAKEALMRAKKLSAGLMEPASDAVRAENVALDATVAALLANDVALGEDETALEASAFLVEHLWAFALWASAVSMAFATGAPVDASAQEAQKRIAPYTKMASEFFSEVNPHAARVLRAGTLAQVRPILWRIASTGRGEKAEKAFEAFRARAEGPLAPEKLVTYVGLLAPSSVPDSQRFDDAMRDATKAVMTFDEEARRPLLAKLNKATAVRQRVKRLAALEANNVDERVARYDLLIALELVQDADTVLGSLERGPDANHGRVRVRLAHREIRRRLQSEGTLAATRSALKLLEARSPSPPHAEFSRLVAIATVIDSRTAANGSRHDAAQSIERAAVAYAKIDAEGASAFSYGARLLTSVTKGQPAEWTPRLAALLRAGAPEIAALRKRFPENVDVIKLMHVHARYMANKQQALAMLLMNNGLDPVDDPSLVVERANTALSQIAIMGYTPETRSAATTLRASLIDLPPSDDETVESAREVALGDIAAWHAAGGDRAAFVEMDRRYTHAERLGSKELRRLRNNRAWALGLAGKHDEALAIYPFAIGEGGDGQLDLGVLAWLNAAQLTNGTPADRDLQATLRQITEAKSEGNELVLLKWLVTHDRDPGERKRHAKRAVAIGVERIYDLPAPTTAVCQPNSEFQFGVETGARIGVFSLGWSCRLWLTDTKLATADELKAAAR